VKSLGWFSSNSPECAQIRELLASRGIPTFFSTRFRARGVLFICLNEQFDDALALLKNPEHEVARPVDIEEFQRAARTQGLGTILVGSVAILLFLLAIVGVLLAVHFFW
jgi:hypothetical protein